jgi:hypothetical protein
VTKYARIELTIDDGTRNPLPDNVRVLVTLSAFRDNKNVQLRSEYRYGSRHVFDVEHLDMGDRFIVNIDPDGYSDSGFGPFSAAPGKTCRVGLMALPHTRRFNFDSATWEALRDNAQDLFRVISFRDPEDEAAARERYNELRTNNPQALAAVLNILTAVADMHWKVDGRPIEFFKGLIWKDMQQDRFYAWAHETFLGRVEEAAAGGEFKPSPKGPHKGASITYKQTNFMTANVQFSFHEGVTAEFGGEKYTKVELDIDYFGDTLSHMFEVIYNGLKGDTDPMKVYVLRWAEGQYSGVPFNPPLTVVA